MEYITVKEASKLWNIDISTIGKLLRASKIEGAAKLGGHWVIPRGTPRPADGRTRAAKEAPNAPFFRFPLFVNFSEESFFPPLSKEEAKLCKAQRDFYACEFENAEKNFKALCENAESIYVKMSAQFFMCLLSAVYDKHISFNRYYCGMILLLSADFAHKKEMALFLPLLCYNLGQFMNIPDLLNSDIQYDFHPSVLYLNGFLSIFKLSPKNIETDDLSCLEAYEALCVVSEKNGYYHEVQKLHAVLFMVYFSANNKERMRYHAGKAVKLAYEHNLIYALADYYGYYADEINKVLCEYPNSFAERVKKASKIIFENYSLFAANADITKMYLKLSQSDFRYLSYAVKGFANKQIADILHVSERTVAKKYNDIYDKLGVTNKHELITEISISLGGEK